MTKRVQRGQLSFEEGRTAQLQRERNARQMRSYWLRNPEKRKEAKRREYYKTSELKREKARRYYQENRERAKAGSRRRALLRLGTTPENRERVLIEQDGRCAICRKEFQSGADTHTDHDHRTGLFRGLLCTRCNNGLGVIERDQMLWLPKALAYLESRHGNVGSAPWKAIQVPRCGRCGELGHNVQTCLVSEAAS